MSQYDLAASSSSEIMCRWPVWGVAGSIKATFVCPKTLWRSQCMSLSLHRMFPSGPVLFLWDILGLTEHIPLYFCFCHFLWIRKQRKKEEHNKWVSIAHCILNFGISNGYGNANNVVKISHKFALNSLYANLRWFYNSSRQWMPSVRNWNRFDG